jgi:lysine 2,3-aminomutase
VRCKTEGAPLAATARASVGIQIIESLRGHTSGFAVPTFVIDAPRGGGKIPIMPNYVLSQSPDHVVVRNYEGFISTYTQPETYQRHDPSTCASCQRHQLDSGEEGQEGVSALFAGERVTIEPEGFAATHQRLRHVVLPPATTTISGNGNRNGHHGL